VATKNETPAARGNSLFDPEELFALAKVELKNGAVSDALEKLKQLTGSADAPDGAFSVCGQIYLQLELWDRAEAMLKKHLERHPGAPDETFFLGSVYYQSARAPQALKIWDELLQKYPSYTPALLYRAILRSQHGENVGARQDLDMLMKVTPVDNPYFKPAKDLMQHLDAQPRPPAPGGTTAGANIPMGLPGNAYKN